MTPFELSTRFFLQLAVVLVACRLTARIAIRLGQPPVVAEMIAGIALGPSLFGWLWPAAQRYVFPPESRSVLFAGAQVGLVLYMFTVGLDFRPHVLGSRLKSAAAVAAAGIAVPCVLGAGLGGLLAGRGLFFPAGISVLQARVFMAAALAITAFPMLARIIVERGLTGTRIGALALAAGAIDDAGSWALLALVVATVRHRPQVAAAAIAGGAMFVLLLFFGVRPLLIRLERRLEPGPRGERPALLWALVALALCAWYTDTIGLYAVFGAGFLGAAFPAGPLAARLRQLIEPLAATLFLPLFFVYSGLNTQVSTIHGTGVWLAGALILAAAVLGKAGSTYAAARLCGEDHATGWAIGALVNARGLMELIALNIGLQYGLVTPTLFALLTLMAVITTLMATPLFDRVLSAVPHDGSLRAAARPAG